MRKIAIYILITLLVFSQNPVQSMAAEGSLKDTDEKVVLLADQIDEDIEGFRYIDSIERDEPEYLLEDESEAVLLSDEKEIEWDNKKYSLIRYFIDESEKSDSVELYVESTNIIPLEKIELAKEERDKQIDLERNDVEESKSEEVEEKPNHTSQSSEVDPQSTEAKKSEQIDETEEVVEENDQVDLVEAENNSDIKEEQQPIQTSSTFMQSRSTVFVLENGMRHAEVKTLKANLKKLGFTVPGNGTTYYGRETERKVRDFQAYYGLASDGKAGPATLSKVDEIVNSPLQKGKRHNNTKKLKADLKAIGYTVPGNGTTLYGVQTEAVVMKFQKDKDLVVNGIADEPTLDKIAALQKQVSNPTVLENGIRHTKVKTLKANLKKLGFTVPGKGTTYYGKETERKVRDFQSYYGLSADGKAGPATFSKITSVLSSPLQKGKRHNDTKKLKADLKSIGYTVPGNGTTLYGTQTEAVVKKFQKDKSLVVNGIADERTLAKIAQLKAQVTKPSQPTNPSVLTNGMRHAKVKTLKADLKKLGFAVPGNGTTLYGIETERKVKEFQSYYGLSADGKAGPATFSKITSVLNSPLQKGKRHNNTKKLKADLKSIGYPVPGNGTTLFGVETEKIVKQFQKDYKLAVNGIADDPTLAKIASLGPNKNPIKIFIDPGHGGSDGGATSNGVAEKTLTLDISKRINKYLTQYRGVTTKMSRTSDVYLTLAQRTQAANTWKADFFFSVHINSGGGHGVESFIYNNKPTQDEINKQKIIHDYITSKVSDRDRGKKRANFHVLRESNMSAMLFEYLFVDTASDRKKLTNASYRDKLAKATAEGIAKAYGLKK